MMAGDASGDKVDCVIVGAGVLGLTIALELVSRGIHPVILARDLPEDVDSKAFASPWAGANWSSSATTDAERHRDQITFGRFEKMASQTPELVRVTPFVFFSTDETYDRPWYHELVHDYTQIPSDQVPRGYKSGVTYKSLTINAPRYLGHLAKQLRANKVKIVRCTLNSIDDALSTYPDMDLIINASGLGSKSLHGVKDEQLYPGRGQTVLVRAPHITTCYNHRLDWTTSTRRYIIPRPGPEGEVILGGTFEPNETATEPDPKVAERIMKDACDMCPDLGKWDELDVISHQIGLRPMRKGGMRLEHEKRKRSRPFDGSDEHYDCIHAYGIGSGGYQASWGVAEEVADLVQKCWKDQTLSEDLSGVLEDGLAKVQLS